MSLNVISLFSGCGGFDLGLQGGFNYLSNYYRRNPFQVVFANDISSPTCDTYEANFKHTITRGDISDITKNKVSNIPNCDIVIGGFPCQDFSLNGKRRRFKTKRGRLYQQMVRMVDLKKPYAFIAENVQGLISFGALDKIKKEFSCAGEGYVVTHHLVSAANYGIPQNRIRVFIVGIKKELNTRFEASNESHSKDFTEKKKLFVTVRDAIGDLIGMEDIIPNHNEYSRARFYLKRWQGTEIINPNKPAPTIRAHHHGNIQFHYEGHRRLTVRECARIQSFPDEFRFTSTMTQNYVDVGNAVPPVLSWHFFRKLGITLRNCGVL